MILNKNIDISKINVGVKYLPALKSIVKATIDEMVKDEVISLTKKFKVGSDEWVITQSYYRVDPYGAIKEITIRSGKLTSRYLAYVRDLVSDFFYFHYGIKSEDIRLLCIWEKNEIQITVRVEDKIVDKLSIRK